MMHFAGVFTMLALASRCAYGQPTIDVGAFDDLFHWRDGRQLLEQMLNESVEGQRRLEMQVSLLQQQQQQVDNQMTRYASLQHQYHQHQQQQLSFSSMIDNITAKLEVVSRDVSAIKDTVEIKNQSGEMIASNLSLQLTRLGEVLGERLVEMKNSTTTAIEDVRATLQNEVSDSISQVLGTLANISRSQDRQRAASERAEEQLQLLRVVALDSRELIANNMSTHLASIEQSCIEVRSGLTEVVQAQEQVQSELLGQAVEEIQNSISGNISRILGMVKQGQNQLFVEVEKNGNESERNFNIEQGKPCRISWTNHGHE